ncbi:MAG: 50S ribosomal protein L9 [Myxococcota bacterium]|nr:50S ribosomal protein L9 [Myxococcota bacterium]
MQVILLEDMPNLGGIGEQVNARDGYARNYLFPNKLAVPASTNNAKRLAHEKRVANFRLAKAKAEAEGVAKKLSATAVSIARKVGEQNKLFGSVSAHDVEQALLEKGVKVDRRKIDVGEPIRQVGEYDVKIRLVGGVAATIKVSVVAEA